MARKHDTTQLDLFVTEPKPRKRKPVSEAARQKMRENRLGKKWSDDVKEKFRQSHLGLLVGEKNPRWSGGESELLCKTCQQPFKTKRYRLGIVKYCSIACRKADPDKRSSLHHRIRNSKEYLDWRLAVFTRDDFTCQLCGLHSGNGKAVVLNADHIKPFATYPELRFDVDNGRTLCRACHKKTDTFGVKTWRK